MHINDNFLRHSGIGRYGIIECPSIESLISDHGIVLGTRVQFSWCAVNRPSLAARAVQCCYCYWELYGMD